VAATGPVCSRADASYRSIALAGMLLITAIDRRAVRVNNHGISGGSIIGSLSAQ